MPSSILPCGVVTTHLSSPGSMCQGYTSSPPVRSPSLGRCDDALGYLIAAFAAVTSFPFAPAVAARLPSLQHSVETIELLRELVGPGFVQVFESLGKFLHHLLPLLILNTFHTLFRFHVLASLVPSLPREYSSIRSFAVCLISFISARVVVAMALTRVSRRFFRGLHAFFRLSRRLLDFCFLRCDFRFYPLSRAFSVSAFTVAGAGLPTVVSTFGTAFVDPSSANATLTESRSDAAILTASHCFYCTHTKKMIINLC